MLRKYHAANEHELKEKLAEQGQTLDEIREAYKLDFLAKGFMEQKLGPKMKVELPEMRDYYNAHLHDFDRPAQVVWREVLVEVEKSPSRAAARQKADAILARLTRGEDFEKVAQTASEGPNKAKGGLWETTPGGYAVEAVNSALQTLPQKQISQVIEGPSSYHIVRVESRRDAGPARFDEVQDESREKLHRFKIQKESTAYIDNLRAKTIVTTMFDGSESAPALRPIDKAPSQP